MAFAVSPGVKVNEFDITTIIPAVSVSAGAIAGVFQWGPLNERVFIDTETTLGARFFTPSNFNAETWFSTANFLGYGNLYVSRAGSIEGNTITTTAGNSSVNAISAGSNVMTFTTTANLNLAVGQVLFNIANTSAVFTQANPTIVGFINSSAISLSSDAVANVATTQLTFRDNIVYSAVAQENPTPQINWAGQIVANNFNYLAKQNTFDPSVNWVARYPGLPGNSLRIAVCDSPGQFSSVIPLAPNTSTFNSNSTVASATPGNNQINFVFTSANTSDLTQANGIFAYTSNVASQFGVGDLVKVGTPTVGYQFMQVANVGLIANTSNSTTFTSSQFSITCNQNFRLGSAVTQNTVSRFWEFYNDTKVAPGQSPYVLNFGNTACNDELHVVVIDENGAFTGVPDTIVEVYTNLSRATDALSVDGTSNYYATVINQASKYVWFANDRATAVSNTAAYVQSSTAKAPLSATFVGGSNGPDESNVPLGQLTFAYDQFASAEDVDISLVLQGKARGSQVGAYSELGQYLIQNICEQRKDCVAFISPDINDVVNQYGEQASNIIAMRNILTSSSYGVMDTGYKYQYDRYNNIYRWIPLNGDIAGLCTRTDTTNNPWWSPAGFNRGQINNVVKLAFNPSAADRDLLYAAGINPVVSFPGQGTILYGDKTLLDRPSAFDRINVRRLFIVLEKAISTAAKFLLFEFNDGFTQATFKNMVNPYLRQIQGMRGITDFLVVCDGTNNPPTVVDANQFVGDIYVKPARSINFIQLNFVSVPTGTQFSEVVGQFGGS